jgi:hypothetical protein
LRKNNSRQKGTEGDPQKQVHRREVKNPENQREREREKVPVAYRPLTLLSAQLQSITTAFCRHLPTFQCTLYHLKVILFIGCK